MNKSVVLIVLFLCIFRITNSQNIVKGIVVDHNSKNPLSNVLIRVKNTIVTTNTTINGVFTIADLANGNYILEFTFNGFESQNFPITLVEIR